MQLYHDIDIHEDKHSIEEIIISSMVGPCGRIQIQ